MNEQSGIENLEVTGNCPRLYPINVPQAGSFQYPAYIQKPPNRSGPFYEKMDGRCTLVNDFTDVTSNSGLAAYAVLHLGFNGPIKNASP